MNNPPKHEPVEPALDAADSDEDDLVPTSDIVLISRDDLISHEDSGIHLKPATDVPTYEELKAHAIKEMGQEWFDKYGDESIKAALVVSGNAPRSAYKG